MSVTISNSERSNSVHINEQWVYETLSDIRVEVGQICQKVVTLNNHLATLNGTMKDLQNLTIDQENRLITVERQMKSSKMTLQSIAGIAKDILVAVIIAYIVFTWGIK